MVAILQWLPPIGLLLDVLGAVILFRHSDAVLKVGLSVRAVGLLDEEDDTSERANQEKANNFWEIMGFALILMGSLAQFIAQVASILK